MRKNRQGWVNLRWHASICIYSTAVNTFKETRDKTTKQYNKDLEAIELEIDELAKEINRQIIAREQQQQKTDRTKEIQKLKAESEGILQDIRRIEKAVVVEDQFLNRKDKGLLDKTLARRYQQKLVKHKRNLKNRLNRRQQIIKGKGLTLDVTPDDELFDGGYSSIEEFKDRETLPHRYRIKGVGLEKIILAYLIIQLKFQNIIQ